MAHAAASTASVSSPSASQPLSVPVLRDVDILVVGSSCAAVAAALEARQAGRSVMAVSDFGYFGSDLAGAFQLWPGQWRLDDPILQTAFAECEPVAVSNGSVPSPVRPGTIKRTLEEALIAAAIPFLYLSRPVALLRDDTGALAGAVLATRTSLIGVTCRSVIDATEHGLGLRLAGISIVPREEPPSPVEWTILAKNPPTGWPGTVEELQPPFCQTLADGSATYRAFRLGIERAALGSDPAAMEHVARGLLVDENVLITADLLVDSPRERIATPSAPKASKASGLAELEEADLQPAPQLWALNALLPLSAAALREWRQPDHCVALGRRIGAAAAAAVPAGMKRPGLHLQSGGAQTGDLRFAHAFLREPGKTQTQTQAQGTPQTLELTGWPSPLASFGKFDVVVAGGGTGGAPAGIAAARAGASTVVLETQHGLGGVGTLGLISSYWFGNKVGFTAELNEAVSGADSLSRSKNANTWSTEVKAAIYARMLQAAGGRAWFGSYVFGVRMQGGAVNGLLVSTPFGCGLIETRCVVDATGNADIAAAAGAPCRLIDARHVAVQGTGLSPRVKPDVGYKNSDHTFVDETDPVGITAAFLHARAKYPDAFDTAPLVNSRERRQIVGELEVSPLDILACRTFPDTVFTACSNFDTHGFIVHPLFMVAAPDHKALSAHVPFRCMLPRGVEGVLVTGLGMSAHRDALPVIRMQADVQNQGYAAGLAAAWAAEKGVAFRDLDIRALQRSLVDLGILAPEVAEQEDSFPMNPQSIREAAAGDLGALMNVAILFAHPEQSRDLLLEILRNDSDPKRRSDASLILGLMGVAEAAPVLEETVRQTPWDEGWNYRGMGQFGPSMSRLDATIIALARTGSPIGIKAIEEKIRTLDETAFFSHCRAVSLATGALADPRLSSALACLLEKPGMRGHAWLCAEAVRAQANDDTTETEARNLALRELHLARGLFLGGDVNHLGRNTLEAYACDLRGHFARHARALLDHPEPDRLRFEMA